ncbi:SDR family NAD(P)-dependent oxidoreductase [Hyphomonas johnsonii]|jgi:NAD(P)-dependent dehydrogenase (short-subunit alcohol dehydrogenase family)|uniref:Short chain dehydrogenase/reductase family oxidoreductase n=1 Tax=Hyphomonas johnsonii MHS-2 TaxID=1280950 RepID=A0A059FTD4_9PROT|nr:SDR family NAD(P)-dependent oxidoreductase [Hyphomonas johnsonii]KCZ93713.1 short chain dehydrogenase/reductase family oxidoreductase [Hyphomonas johnsonii MHS-2]
MTEHPRLILVTGASRGIGRAAALQLARAGHMVVAVARSKTALQQLDDAIRAEGNEAILVPLDLKDAKGIETLGKVIGDQFGRLDGLIGNAGVLGTLGPLETSGRRSFEETIEVNLTANWRLIAALAPWLHQAAAPRAVFVTSSVASHPRAFWGPYQASKAGLEAMILGWADETEKMALRVNLFDPGATRTEMRATAAPGEDPMTLPTADQVAAELVKLVAAEESRTGERIRYREIAATTA